MPVATGGPIQLVAMTTWVSVSHVNVMAMPTHVTVTLASVMSVNTTRQVSVMMCHFPVDTDKLYVQPVVLVLEVCKHYLCTI